MPDPSAESLAMAAVLGDARAVFFDAVGTILFPEPSAPSVYAEVGRRHGSRLTAAEIGPRFRTAFGRQEQIDQTLGWRTSEEREGQRWRTIVAEVLDDVNDREACFHELFEHFGQPQAWRLAGDAAQTFAGLAARGYPLVLATNHDRRMHTIVAGLPALAPIQHLAISSEIGWRKPSPHFFAAACRLAGLPASRILHVGDDWTNDYQGAQAAGMRAILLDSAGKGDRAAARIGRLGDLLE